MTDFFSSLFGGDDDNDVGAGASATNYADDPASRQIIQVADQIIDQSLRLTIDPDTGDSLGRSVGPETTPFQTSQPDGVGEDARSTSDFLQNDNSTPLSRQIPSAEQPTFPFQLDRRDDHGGRTVPSSSGEGQTAPVVGRDYPYSPDSSPSQPRWHFSIGTSEGAGAGFAGLPPFSPFLVGPSVAYQTGGNNVFGGSIQGYGQVFVGAVGLGAMLYPISASITGTLLFAETKNSDTLRFGCVPSVLFITPIVSLQISPPAVSISIGTPVLALGIFGGVACSGTLDTPFRKGM
jgi:hypothetical protein